MPQDGQLTATDNRTNSENTADCNDPNGSNLSRWRRFKTWIQKPFSLDSSFMVKEDPDYHTMVYSSNIKQFSEHFDTLRGSRDKYFTPTERALLTYELLSRANVHDLQVHTQQNNDKKPRRGKNPKNKAYKLNS